MVSNRNLILMAPIRGLIGSDPTTRESRIKIYKTVKKVTIVGSSGTLGLTDLGFLLKDAAKNELKAYGYKYFWWIFPGGVFQAASIPFYLIKDSVKCVSFAKTLRDIGYYIWNWQAFGINGVFVVADIVLFGSVIDLEDVPEIKLFSNETLTNVSSQFR